jgi:hypothetical protein
VVPELSALIERMLAKEPEARGTAREVAEAAESAAEHARPEANVPFLDLEWPEAGARAVPVRAVPVPGSEPPRLKAAPAEIDLVRRKHLTLPWAWRPGFVAATLALMLVVGTCWMSPAPQGGPPAAMQAVAPSIDRAPDAGTRGLGDSTPTTRMASQEAPVAPGTKAVTQQVPEKPLPGQMHAPCRGPGQLEINGGCWRRFADPPPCEDGIYEWKGACYWPVPQRPRVQPRTSKPQR